MNVCFQQRLRRFRIVAVKIEKEICRVGSRGRARISRLTCPSVQMSRKMLYSICGARTNSTGCGTTLPMAPISSYKPNCLVRRML